MVHFDLKSSHVLLSEECKAKIANFGMGCGRAKEMDAAQPVMTQLWAAPEVSTEHRACSLNGDAHHCDVCCMPLVMLILQLIRYLDTDYGYQ